MEVNVYCQYPLEFLKRVLGRGEGREIYKSRPLRIEIYYTDLNSKSWIFVRHEDFPRSCVYREGGREEGKQI